MAICDQHAIKNASSHAADSAAHLYDALTIERLLSLATAARAAFQEVLVTVLALDSPSTAESAAVVCLRFRLSRGGGAWHLTEETQGLLGGVFGSLAAAVGYVVAEARSSAGSTLVVELGARPWT